MINRMPPEAEDDRAMGVDGRALAREIRAAPELERMIGELLKLGVSPEAIRRAHERGRVEDAIFDAVLDPARTERTVSPSQIEADGGLRVAETQLIALAFGLRAPEPDEPYFTPEEAAVLQRFGELREIWPPEVYLQVVRVYGQALAHIAQTEVHAFRLYVEPRLRAASGGVLRALPAVHAAFGQLLPLADPMLLGIHRRGVEHELAQAAVREAELRTPEGVLPGAVEVTLVFCDLKDFTAYADLHGDVAAVEAIERFAVTVTAERGEKGHVLKTLGDGYMLSYPEPAAAVAACVRIIEQMRSDDTPGVHASVHHGVALYREGDYFGKAVNLAARLLGQAGRGELVASEAVARATEGRFDWEHLGSRRIRGVSEPVDAYRLRIPREAG
jgi:adenylate cyclase